MAERIEIRLTERRPVSVDPDQWPMTAEATDYDGETQAESQSEWYVRVLEHADGRRIVYGCRQPGLVPQPRGTINPYAGRLLASDESEPALASAILVVAETIGRLDLGRSCIADLPAEAL
jgi:hypothetical protein